MDNFPESKRELGLDYEPVWCGHCNGSGRMVRDPDIGTDQECFVCDGAGVPAAPVQEPVVQNICIECANADSWGLPDKPACRSCVSNSEWKPLNVSSKNPATPPAAQRPVAKPHKWVGLDGDDQIKEMWLQMNPQSLVNFARAIEAKLKEKNSD